MKDIGIAIQEHHSTVITDYSDIRGMLLHLLVLSVKDVVLYHKARNRIKRDQELISIKGSVSKSRHVRKNLENPSVRWL